MPARLTCSGVSKSGSPISRWTIERPSASKARASPRTSNAFSLPSRERPRESCSVGRAVNMNEGPVNSGQGRLRWCAERPSGNMRTLTEVFAPGASPLPEGLRTLVVSPERTVEPGMTVRATFAFYNMGGAPATGLRVRFTLPDGLRYLVGSARIDDVPLDEPGGETALLASNGADIGEVPPGTERKISISYLVASTIENGATIELQAAIASLEIPVIGSNVLRLVARSAPELRNASTGVALEPVRE